MTTTKIKPIDGDGTPLHEGDRVYTHDYLKGEITRFYGTLGYEECEAGWSGWYVAYDDGESCRVLDWSQIFKA